MNRLTAYRILILLAALLPGLAGCRKAREEDRIDWSVSLDHTKKTPYGSSLAYESFPDYFPGAKREPLTKYFRYTAVNETGNASGDSVHMMVLLGLNFRLTQPEWLQLLRFVRNGNEVFLLTASVDPKVCKDLCLRERHRGSEKQALTQWNSGNAAAVLTLGSDSVNRFGYSGRYIGGWFEAGQRDTAGEVLVPAAEDESQAADEDADDRPDAGTTANLMDERMLRSSIDTQYEVLGGAPDGADFIRFRIGGGHLTLHAAPLVLSNYFLLQPENRPYLDGIWHRFPANVSRVYWNEFFERKTEQSSLGGLLKHPAMRYALLIAALTLLLYVLFSMKRRQRIIPVIPPLENASVSFVETVGRLYFNKGNHQNLAEKMVQHFLEWVRTTYYLDTSVQDQAFVEHLSMKSGKSLEETQALINMMHQLRLNDHGIPPEFLHELYRRIQSFY